MATVAERRVAAIVGCFMADAAAQPLHWNYDLERLKSIIGNKPEVEFWELSANPYYDIETGRQSCYGDQAYVILKSLIDCQGVNIDHLKEETYRFFGRGSSYENTDNENYTWKGAIQKTYPIKGPWKHFSIKDFLKNYQARQQETGSASDEQIDCVAKIAPLVALYAGSEDLLDKAEDVIRLTQMADTTVAIGLAGVRLLEHYVLNGPDRNALSHVIEELSNPRRKNPQDLDKAVAGYLRRVLEKQEIPHGKVLSSSFRID